MASLTSETSKWASAPVSLGLGATLVDVDYESIKSTISDLRIKTGIGQILRSADITDLINLIHRIFSHTHDYQDWSSKGEYGNNGVRDQGPYKRTTGTMQYAVDNTNLVTSYQPTAQYPSVGQIIPVSHQNYCAIGTDYIRNHNHYGIDHVGPD